MCKKITILRLLLLLNKKQGGNRHICNNKDKDNEDISSIEVSLIDHNDIWGQPHESNK
jgi:hypothetical protein